LGVLMDVAIELLERADHIAQSGDDGPSAGRLRHDVSLPTSCWAMLRRMDVPRGFDPTLILVLNLAGTFVFGLSGGLAAVRAKLDLFGVVVLAGVVGLAGGITRDLLIGVPPATFRDWRYLAAAAAAGLTCYFARPALERIRRSVLVFDAL